jgi:cold shock CspA family protein
MDEYRPFPSEQPPDEPVDDEPMDDAPETEPEEEPEAAAPTAVLPPLDAAGDEGTGGGRGERPAPNLDHPGGHLHGSVARLNKPRRFGFLRADDGVEIFFHASAIDSGPNAFDALRPGQEVEFDCHQDEQGRGLAASVVTVVGEPPPEAPRPPRAPRAERGERGERGERSERATARERRGGSAERWHVAVLRERFDMPVASQLERLLNERAVKPGNFTLGFVEHEEGTDCWVAYFSAVDGSS